MAKPFTAKQQARRRAMGDPTDLRWLATLDRAAKAHAKQQAGLEGQVALLRQLLRERPALATSAPTEAPRG
jgi:hypothetical protein